MNGPGQRVGEVQPRAATLEPTPAFPDDRGVALTTVAGSCCQRYSGRVRRLTSQRALIALLLVVRLFFGGPVDAMPHISAELGGGVKSLSTTGSTGVHCANHDAGTGAGGGTTSSEDAHRHSGSSGEDDHDCCKTGSCECPCTHLSAYAVILATPLEGFAGRLPAMECVVDPPCDRPNRLFRPPA